VRDFKQINNELSRDRFILSGEGFDLYTTYPKKVIFDHQYSCNGWHAHNVFEVCICTNGSGYFHSGGKEMFFSQGSVFVGSPGIPHEIHVSQGETAEIFYFVFRGDLKKIEGIPGAEYRTVEDFFSSRKNIIHGCTRLLQYPALFSLYGSYEKSPAYSSLLKALLLETMGQLSRTHSTDFEQRITDYITLHLTENISISDLAKVLSISERGVYFFFQQTFGMSPHKYLNQVRVSIAAGYLHMGFPAGKAGEKAGFPDAPTFTRVFKREYGITPKEYISQNQKEEI
jgi:AraC-like DNA-binding protein/quercetin dioxygenase-like cupin family protein